MNLTRPRPWFVTFNAIWDQQDQFDELYSTLTDLKVFDDLPFHQRMIPIKQLHTTIISLIRINDWPSPLCVEDVCNNAFETWMKTLDMTAISEAFEGFSLNGYELRYYDTVTAIQFKCSTNKVQRFRDFVRAELRTKVVNLVSDLESYGLNCELQMDLERFLSDHLHSALARSPFPGDLIREGRSAKSLFGVTLRVSNLRLMVSDESMSNPVARDLSRSLIVRSR